MTTNSSGVSDSTLPESVNYTADDWITDRQDKGKKFEFARADGRDQAELLLPFTQIRSWASSKVLGRPSASVGPSDQLYKPIGDKSEFRVMELKPGAFDEPLKCVLRHCSVEFVTTEDNLFTHTAYTPEDEKYWGRFALSTSDYVTPIRYTALSYTWGRPDPGTDTTIHCEGHELKITKSLATALNHFRKTDHSIVMWIDQICINQESIEEKVQQIPLMSSIYQRAMNTAIWLGEAVPGSDSALRLLDDIGTRLQFSNANVGPDDFERIQLPLPTSRQWQYLKDLLGRQWFSRLWIIQEVILAKEPWVLCGDLCIHWSVIDLACDQLAASGISHWLQHSYSATGALGRRADDRADVCESIRDLGAIKLTHDQFIARPPLLNLLISTRNAQCYDARDKIYGLLGICADRDRDAVHISYVSDWTAAKLYHDMTVNLLHLGVPLIRMLVAVDHESLDLPSWVPDWRLPRATTALGDSSSMIAVYKASGNFSWKSKSGASYTIGGLNSADLHLRGYSVGTLGHIGSQFLEPDISYLDPSVENKTLLEAHEFVDSNLEHLSESSQREIFNTFWHTLVAGQDADGLRKCPESFAEIFSLLLDESTGRSPSLPGQTYSKRQILPKGRGKLEIGNLSSRKVGQTFQEIRTVFRRVVRNRRLGIVGNDLLGLFPSHCKRGDMLYVTEGLIVPLLLRPMKDARGKFRLVGECYVDDIMQGQAFGTQHSAPEEIVLV